MGKQAVNIYQDQVRKNLSMIKAGSLVVDPALALCAEAGEVAGKIYKNMRDMQSYVPGMESGKELIKELGDCLFYITAMAQDLGYDLQDVIDINYEKILKRAETDTISGDGDNREIL